MIKVIATTRAQPNKRYWQKISRGWRLFWGALWLLIVLLSILFQVYVSLVFMVVILVLAIKIGSLPINDYFECYLKNDLLVFEFDEQISARGIHHSFLRQLPYPIAEIKGYTLHSFFSKKPKLLQLHFDKYSPFQSELLPIEFLPKREQQKLFKFLDRIAGKKEHIRRSPLRRLR